MEEEAPVIAEEEQREAEFTCKRCRQKLFEQADLDDHEQSAQKISRRKVRVSAGRRPYLMAAT